MSSLGKEIAQMTGTMGTTMHLYEAGILLYYKRPILYCECLGWDASLEIIPKQQIVGVSVSGRSECCCVPLCFIDACHRKESRVTFDLLMTEQKKDPLAAVKFVDPTHKAICFKWKEDELASKAGILHNYVYGCTASCGIVGEAHTLGHFIQQGIVKPTRAKLKLSKY